MAIYQPIEEPVTKQEWIAYLETQKEWLDGRQQDEITRDIMESQDGDLEDFKRMVGSMLATLKGEIVIIN